MFSPKTFRIGGIRVIEIRFHLQKVQVLHSIAEGMRIVRLDLLILFSTTALSDAFDVTVVSYFPSVTGLQSLEQSIGGYLLGYERLKQRVANRVNISWEFRFDDSVKSCPELEMSVADWAAEQYYRALRK